MLRRALLLPAGDIHLKGNLPTYSGAAGPGTAADTLMTPIHNGPS